MRCRLIDQIDGLVGQLTAGDIAVRERRGGDQRVVADRHLVVRLVTLLQATQNRDRVLHARLAHEHLLETTLKRRSFSMFSRYSSSVVAPIRRSSPRAAWA